MSINFSEPDWHSISDMEITNFLESHSQLTGYVAGAAAETAKRIFRWCKDNYPHPNCWRMPANTMGFHSGFFRHIQERRAVKNRLEQMIHDAATALDRTCRVGTIIIHLHGECHPETGLLPITPELAPHNAIIHATDTISRNAAFEPVMAKLKQFILAFILTLFLRDWRQRAFSSRYITADALFLQPVENLLPSEWSFPIHPDSPAPTASTAPTVSMPSMPTPPASPVLGPAPTAWTAPMPSTPSTPAPSASMAPSASTFSTPAPFASQMPAGPSSQAVSDDTSFMGVDIPISSIILPPSVMDLLKDMNANNGEVLMVEEIFKHHVHCAWVEELQRMGYNAGTAIALNALMHRA